MKKYLLIILIMGSYIPLMAQQTPDFSQYYKNPYLINPATAGLESYTQLMVLYRQQWMGIEGAPTTQALTFTSPLAHHRMGIGLYLYNDVANILGSSGALASYRYTIPLTSEHLLSLGLAAGLANNRIYFDRIRAEDAFESSLLQNMEGGAYADGTFGLHYRFKKLQLGFAAQQLLANRLNYENSTDEKKLAYNLIRHYNITAAYSFQLSEQVSLDPYLLVKSAQGLAVQYDVNTIFKYKENSWFGLGYRANSSLAVSVGIDFDDRFTFGYAYEVPVNALAGVSGSTHEFMVGIRLGKGTGSGPAKEGSKAESASLQRGLQEQYELLDQLQQNNEILEKEVRYNKETIGKQKEEIEELKRALKEHQEEITTVIEEVKVTEVPQEKAEGTEYFAVVGAFKTIKYAKLFQKILQRELQMETAVVQSQRISGMNYFFIYTKSFAEFQDAQNEVKRISEQDSKALIVGNPWIYEKK